MPDAPTGVSVRMYNVGFGDCFLLTFEYANFNRHVLIDFGTMALPRPAVDDADAEHPNTTKKDEEEKKKPKHLHGTLDIAENIAAKCGGEGLTAVVATHRHQDHISGFAGSSGSKIVGLKPRLVLQPWTENPNLDEHATAPGSSTAKHFKLMNDDLEAMLADHGLLFVAGEKHGGEFAGVDFDLDQLSSPIQRYADSPSGIAEHAVRDIVLMGNNNIKNMEAVQRLAGMAKSHYPDQGQEYLHAGEITNLAEELPGVKVHVLGPPTADEANIQVQRSHDDTEFWHMSRNAWGVGLRGLALGDESWHRFDSSGDPPIECRWLAGHISHVRPSDLLAIVGDLDDALNNTSLILLFEVWEGDNRRLLLFPGDAQIEDWKHCFEHSPVRGLLHDVDVYKVGHHGSLNATPKASLWERFAKRGYEDGLVTLLSTCDDRHGHKENETEVPRGPLVDALKQHSRLVDTRELSKRDQPMFVDLVIEPGKPIEVHYGKAAAAEAAEE